MSELLTVSQIVVNKTFINKVYLHLQNCGMDGFEGVALWAGIIEKNKFKVKEAIIPVQEGFRSEEGLLYTVDGEELYRINKWLYQKNQTLMVQIHSHPGRAFHSETDDRYPIISQFGGISIVVPNFGFDQFSIESWAVYRLSLSNVWTELSQIEKLSLFLIN